MDTMKGNVMKIKSQHFPKDAGSFTIEAALIMPVVIFITIAAVFSGLVLCQQTLVQGCANRAAERGAEIWADPDANIKTGTFNQHGAAESSLYWRIYDKDSDKKIEQVREYAQELLLGKSLFVPAETLINVSVGNKLLYKELTVKITFRYKLPFAGTGIFFGSEDGITVKAESAVLIGDTVEFIRNTDFILDIGKEIKEAFPQIEELKNNITDIVTDLLGNLFPK